MKKNFLFKSRLCFVKESVTAHPVNPPESGHMIICVVNHTSLTTILYGQPIWL